MEKITDIIESIANEKGLDPADVGARVKTAFIQTAKRLFGEQFIYDSEVDPVTKKVKLYQKVQVVADNDERAGQDNFIAISEAKKHGDAEIGDELSYDINIENLGRTASQVLAKELNYHIQRLLEEKIFESYKNKIGTLAHGTVTKIDASETTFVEIDDIKAYMPQKNRIKGESFKVGDVVQAVIKNAYIDKNQGIKLELSRTSPKFLEAILRTEVPEIKDGSVIIQACARIPGKRTKIALSSVSPNIDPVGATVGKGGTRIDAVSKFLSKNLSEEDKKAGGESIDAFEYSASPEILISRAMAPAIVNSVKITDENKAIVYINPDQKSKAIGKNGLNIRLASMLSGYEIELIETGTSSEKVSNEEGLKNLEALFGGL
ncbi:MULTISPECIES: transcription termination factor NusA [unclassified Campylobacter]|uniref:transcription termination factor NusA n=1 Tax=unclassified Campylobacter TaxID=2593542 RepID=UPI0022EA0A5B|nr:MULTISPECIES: transcription termination factor NusA [unclassified Campylobacter]MDA3055068.1 transcription termination factor NusA [Campylobacter sp. VBCF_07 NA4]MDA3060570.1 transcription termination factor NusA [Campylobacter sp. VBCF_02 NA5]MDA3070164.1 transcription termination factor NusA [Campylobacter sp. VBCF_08 NA3]WBR54598.1 transcription termination factor NusA [Campylobacter sp. VBCF_01 NA2]